MVLGTVWNTHLSAMLHDRAAGAHVHAQPTAEQERAMRDSLQTTMLQDTRNGQQEGLTWIAQK